TDGAVGGGSVIVVGRPRFDEGDSIGGLLDRGHGRSRLTPIVAHSRVPVRALPPVGAFQSINATDIAVGARLARVDTVAAIPLLAGAAGKTVAGADVDRIVLDVRENLHVVRDAVYVAAV